MALLPDAQSGLSIGTLSKRLDIPPSTLAHHLRELEASGVVRRDIVGRSTIIRPNLDALQHVASTLMQLCCPGDPVKP